MSINGNGALIWTQWKKSSQMEPVWGISGFIHVTPVVVHAGEDDQSGISGVCVLFFLLPFCTHGELILALVPILLLFCFTK